MSDPESPRETQRDQERTPALAAANHHPRTKAHSTLQRTPRVPAMHVSRRAGAGGVRAAALLARAGAAPGVGGPGRRARPAAARALAVNKLRNAGQVCIAPTRFYVQQGIYDRFLSELVSAFESVKVGDGLTEGTQMGPLCHRGRVNAMEKLVEDARENGARVLTCLLYTSDAADE